MAYTGTVALRPDSIAGCFQSFTETYDKDGVLRSNMQSGQTVKTRRLVTDLIRTATASVTVPAGEVLAWREWYVQRCKNGVLPTRFKMPYPDASGVIAEEIWRFAGPIQLEWIKGGATGGAIAAKLSFNLEQLPAWAA